jgi:signal transduction histidine kinase
MDPTALTERLSALPTLSDLPSSELEWLARNGEYVRYGVGETIAVKGVRIERLWIVLSGQMSVYRETPAGRRRVMSWGPGDVTGRLPYSRMTVSSVDIPMEVPVEGVVVHEDRFPELVIQCPAFTQHTVSLMVDRARRFKATELQAEKLLSLGRLSAGLAHELNNPASATVRGAARLREGLADTERAARDLFVAGLDESTLAFLEEARTRCMNASATGVLSALEQADREGEIEDWLDDHDCDPAHAGPLAETSLTVEALDRLASVLPEATLDAALRWIAASCTTHSVAAGIEGAARRIHDLVAAVKRFTYMDNLTAVDTVQVGQGLKDTVTVLAANARGKGASVKVEVEGDLPPVRASGSELNQVWMNLVDNALDAIPESGSVEVTARLEGGRVVVQVVDDGPGIPDDVVDHIFDPFFSTKGPGQGTGLGLDIARRIVVQNGGGIDVESRPGRTEFRVTLAAGEEAHP